jgi:alpha-tubulin suppressor-like RCC1 family protein
MKTICITNTANLVLGFALLVFEISTSTCAGGVVAAWGDNSQGQIVLPNELNNMNNIKAIAAGVNTCPRSIALRADGAVVVWPDTYVPPGLSSVTAVAAGYYFRMALRSDGRVVAWGSNGYGETDVPDDLTNAVAIGAGLSHSLGLTADGRVVAWGSNWVGQRNVPPGLSNVVAIAAGEFHSLALKAAGTVVAWGHDSGGGETRVPVGLSNVVAIAAGQSHSVALKADGTVVSWGGPWVAPPPPGLSNVTAISASYLQTLARKADGTVVAWGVRTNVPLGMSNVTAIAAGGTYALALVPEGPPSILAHPQSLAAAYPYSNVTFSVLATGREPLNYQWFLNGTVVSDGARIRGSTNATLHISIPVPSDLGNYTVLVSNAFGCVLSSPAALAVAGPPFVTVQPIDQTVRAGSDVSLTVSVLGSPQLGYQWFRGNGILAGATNSSLALTNVQPADSSLYFVLVTNAHGAATSAAALLTVTNSAPYILSQPTDWSGFVGYGATFSIAARGSLPLTYQWRFNGTDIPGATKASLTLNNLSLGQAGYYHVVVSNPFGHVISAKAFLTVEKTDVVVWGNNAPTNLPPGLTNLVAVAGGHSQIVGVKPDGTVQSWANPNYGYLTNVPVGATNVVAVAAGMNNMALRSDGAIVTWGGFPTPLPNGLSNVLAVAEKYAFALALLSNNTVLAWGDNAYGQRNVPPGLSNVVAIATGAYHGLAARVDGSVVAWGGNQVGQTNIPAGLSDVIAVAGGSYHSLALKADGTVRVWGGNLGVTNVPANLSNVVAIAGGNSQSLALKADGSLVAWGSYQTPSLPAGLSNVFAITSGGAPSQPSFYAVLVGDGSPHITISPVSQAVLREASVRLHALAVGIQPMRYQWQWNGQNLPGATNAYLTVSNAPGNYRMIAVNALAAVTSRTARVTIPSILVNTNLGVALNATNLAWNTYSYNRGQQSRYGLWVAEDQVTHDGQAAAQSGSITNSEQSILQTTVTERGNLTFWWKVSSEADYDFLNFYLDSTNAAAISGELDWQQHSVAIPSGVHTLKWVYTKDATVTAGQDAGWLDEVVFTPASPLILGPPSVQPDGTFVFVSSDVGGRSFLPENLAFIEIQGSTNLSDWATLVNACTLTNGSLLIRDPDRAQRAQRFYRIIEH